MSRLFALSGSLAALSLLLIVLALVLADRPNTNIKKSPGAPTVGVTVAPTVEAQPPYQSCAEASAANVAPVHEEDPGYNPDLDLDQDGLACES